MASSDFGLNISELLLAPIHEIEENLEGIITKVKEDVKTDEETALLCVKFVFENLLSFLPVSDLDEIILQDVCSVAENIFISTILGIDNLKSIDGLSQTQFNANDTCCSLLALCIEIQSYFVCGCEHIINKGTAKLSDIKSLIDGCCTILRESFVHCHKNRDTYKSRGDNVRETVSELQKLSCKLSQVVMELVSSHIDYNLKYDESKDEIVSLVNEVAKLSIEVLNEDVQSMVNVWKTVLNLYGKFADLLKIHFNTNFVVEALCKKILNNFDSFLIHESMTAKPNLNDLKVASFLLKILIKLCGYFANKMEDEFKDLLKLLLHLYRSTPSYLSSKNIPLEVVTEINKLLVIGAEPLLNQLFKEEAFLRQLSRILEKEIPSNPYGSIMLILAVAKKINSSPLREKLLSENVNLLEHCFQAISSCHSGIIQKTMRPAGSTTVGQPVEESDLYQVILYGASSFVLSSSATEFTLIEETLLKNILSTDPWCIMLSSDIWCLTARYADACLCHDMLAALIPVHEFLEKNRPEVIGLSTLISRLLPFCEPQFLSNLSKKYPLSSFPKFWKIRSVETGRILSDTIQETLPSVEMRLLGEHRSTNDLDDLVDKVLFAAGAIAGGASSSNEIWSKIILNLWQFCPEQVLSTPWWTRYISAISSLTSQVITTLSPNIMLQILLNIETILPRMGTIGQKLSLLKILESFSTVFIPNDPVQPSILRLISSIFKELLTDQDDIVKELALKSFAQFAQLTNHTEVISNTVFENERLQNTVTDYLQKNIPNTACPLLPTHTMFIHSCSPTINDDNLDSFDCLDDFESFNCPAKRLKLDNGITCKEIIERVQSDAQFIVQHFTSFTHEQKCAIKATLKTLKSAVKEY